jgi:hypothetical protein
MSTAHVRSINHETKLQDESLSLPSTITTTNITIRLILKFIDNIWDKGDEKNTQNSLTLSVTQFLGNSDLGHKSMFH